MGERRWSYEVAEIGDRIAALTLAGAAELGSYLEEVHRIRPAGISVVDPKSPPDTTVASDAPVLARPAAFDVRLERFAAERKINVIKLVREITQAGLKEAKEMVESTPRVLREQLPEEEALALRRQLEAAGAKVSLA